MARKFQVPIDLTLNELQNFVYQSLGSDPTGVEARVYWNTTSNDLRLYNGTSWISLLAASIGADLTAIEALTGTGLARRTGADTWSLDAATYLTANQSITLSGDITGTGTTAITAAIANSAVTLAKMANVATGTVFYRKTGGAGAPEVQTLATLKTDLDLTGTNSGDQTITLTGDVTGAGTGSFAATIANNAVTNAKLADVATSTIKGRVTAASGDPEDLTPAQVRTLINVADGATANSPNATLLARANHTGTQLASTISDFSTAVAATAAVTANTAKVTNATHTGDVTGDGALTIAADAVTNAKLANMAANTIKGNNTGGTADPDDLTVAEVKTMLAISNVDNTSDSNKPVSTAQQTALDLKVNTSLLGANSGVATLDSGGKVPASQLPSYVDDVVEAANFAALPGTGEQGKIYVTLDSNWTYRWSGSAYIRVGADALTADEALQLATARNISMSGDGTWTVSFDGSGNVSAAMTLANSGVSAGTYNNVATQVRPFTVDAKGRITGIGSAVTIAPAWANIASKPTTISGFGITDGARIFKQAIVGTATSEVITHNLNTRDVQVSLIRVAAPYDQVEFDVEATSVNTVTIRSTVAPGAGTFRIIVVA